MPLRFAEDASRMSSSGDLTADINSAVQSGPHGQEEPRMRAQQIGAVICRPKTPEVGCYQTPSML
jgi:hypothetical protein